MIQDARREAVSNLLRDNPRLAESLRVRLTAYIPHNPTPKQRLFLTLPHREIFYGGAAGGGKSDALCMGALQYVDVPNYSAILFRKTLVDAYRAGAVGDRLRTWLSDTPAKLKDNVWRFPSGAKIEIAGLANELDRFKYQGAEFQYIGFDELTQFYQDDYLYLRSRLRRTKCPYHEGRVVDGTPDPLPYDPQCPSCREYSMLSRVPLRVRAAANPGGIGHLWVKKRFDIGPLVDGFDERGKPRHRKNRNGKTIYIGRNPKRPFIPALIYDNPFVDQAEYVESLRELDPVTREQLLNGDWSISADGRFRKEWARYYSVNGPYIILGPDRHGEAVRIDRCFRFTIIDPAASAREGPGDNQVFKGSPSWTVIGTFLITPKGDLVWLDNRRLRGELPEIVKAIKANYKMHNPAFVGMEYTGLSFYLFSACEHMGLPMKSFKHGGQDKLARATPIITRMERGKVWLPQTAPWLDELEGELFTWTGHPHEQDDQIDVLAYAGLYQTREYQPYDFTDLLDVLGDDHSIRDSLTPGSGDVPAY